MKKAKILYIITQSDWGGAQRYVFDLSRSLKSDFEVGVACGGEGELVERLRSAGITVHRLSCLVREISPLKDWKAFLEIRKLIKEERPDIVHTNSSKAEILGNLAAWLARSPKVVFTAHGFVFNEELGKLRKKFYIFLEKLAASLADWIICVSDFDRRSAIRYGIAPKSKLTVIHNGIESADIRKTEKGWSNKTIVGTVANFYPNKNLGSLVRSAAILRDKGYGDLEFRVVGDGEGRNFLEYEIKRLKLSNFHLLGFREAPEEEMKKFDVFVLPSIKEGFPYVILEAMALGLPVVASRTGGIPEAVKDGETGYLVAPRDEEGLSEKVADFISDPEKRRLFGERGKKKAEEEFSLEKMLKNTRNIYENLVKDRP